MWIFRIIEGIEAPKEIDPNAVTAFLENTSDAIDLIILEELQEKLIQLQTSVTVINKISA